MAEVKEFKGYRYNTQKCGRLADLVCDPYDMVRDKEREKFYEKSEYNIVRVASGKIYEDDTPENNRYKRAGEYMKKWIEENVLIEEDTECMYLYQQRSIYKNTVFVNHGIITLLKLEDISDDANVKICENTKQDYMENRFNLLSHTGANVDTINCMYIDSEQTLNPLMNKITETTPDVEFETTETITNEVTVNKLWIIKERDRLDFIKKCIKPATLFVTDGHNRYYAALHYRNECRKNNPNHTGNESYNYIMASLTNAYGDNLVQLPIHRLYKSEKRFSEDYFIACAQDYFKVEKIIVDTSNDDLTETMKHQVETWRRQNIIGAYFGGNYFYRLTLTDQKHMCNLIPQHTEEYALLDINVLNHLILGELLGVTDDNYDDCVSYVHRSTNGVKVVEDGEATCLFIMNTTKADRICEVVNSGETMPVKSIYLFPKAVTGIVINKMDV